ncbi:MAG: Pantothenate kinase type III, CoaX-like, partial [uncultured Solirubrobacteraceae bacterium]
APGRRRRQHPDPPGDLRRRPAPRALALRDRARVDRRRARRDAAQSARAARHDLRGPDRLHRLLDRARSRPRVVGDGRALPAPPDAGGRARRAHRHGDPHGQPARGGRRPARQRGGRPRPRPRRLRGGRLRHGDHLRLRLARGRVPGRHHRTRSRDLDGGADRARRQAAQDRPRAATHADRQVDRRGHPRGSDLRLRRPGGRDRQPPARRAGRHHARDRHRRPGRRDRPLLRDDRGGRRPAHPRRPAVDLGDQPGLV